MYVWRVCVCVRDSLQTFHFSILFYYNTEEFSLCHQAESGRNLEDPLFISYWIFLHSECFNDFFHINLINVQLSLYKLFLSWSENNWHNKDTILTSNTSLKLMFTSK